MLAAAERAQHEHGCHVEIVTNVIPTFNDDEATLRGIAAWIAAELGPKTPWHVTRFMPYLEFAHLPPTPIRTLERAVRIGHDAGLQFVYVGNVPGHEGENTVCPQLPPARSCAAQGPRLRMSRCGEPSVRCAGKT